MDDRCRLVFRALADDTRTKILELLKERERCVRDICGHFDVSQPSISHHLDMLKRAGLVAATRRGREIYYRLLSNTIIECCDKQFRVFDIKLIRS